MPNFMEIQVGLCVLTAQWKGIVSVPASTWPGSRSLSSTPGPVFPEVVHKGPSLNFQGAPYTFVLCESAKPTVFEYPHCHSYLTV